MTARDVLRWLGWTLTSWRRTTRDQRPGDDDQFRRWPHNLNRFNDTAREDDAERRWQP